MELSAIRLARRRKIAHANNSLIELACKNPMRGGRGSPAVGVEVEVYVNPAAFQAQPPRGHVTLFPQLQVINRVLGAAGLPPYRGPAGGQHLCLRIGSYSTLAGLMHHVAELALGSRPSGSSYQNYLVAGYSEKYPDSAPAFQHLAMHSSCDGYFVPLDFPRILDGRDELVGRFLGSTVRVRAECELLADLHGFPLHRNPIPEDLPGWPSHEDVWNRLYHVGSAAYEWFATTDEWHMMTCAKLHYAACYSIRTNGLMLFS